MQIFQDHEMFFDLIKLKIASKRLRDLAQKLASNKLDVSFEVSSGEVTDSVLALAQKYNELGNSLSELIYDVQYSVDQTRDGIKQADDNLAKRWDSKPVATTNINNTGVNQNSTSSSNSGNVQPDSSNSGSSYVVNSGTMTYKGTQYSTVPNLNEDYFYNQNNYGKFEKSDGSNVGCTATAEAIAYSIYHDENVTPDQVGWSSKGATWTHSQIIDGSKYMNASQRYAVMYENLSNGTPVLVRLPGHHVTAVGIRDGADISNLGPADFLIINPYTGKLDTIAEYGNRHGFGANVLDTNGWSLRIPK